MQGEEQENPSAQAGYGNSRDEDGRMEQDVKTASIEAGDAFVAEVSENPAVRARADASRPLSGE